VKQLGKTDRRERLDCVALADFIVYSTMKSGSGIFSTCGPAHVHRPQVRLSTLRLIALVVGRIVVAASVALDKHPRVIVVAVIIGATVCGDHLHGLLRLLQLVNLACHRPLAIGVPRHHSRRRLIVTPSPLPPSDLRSSG